jgi:hypothetical protein
MAETLSLMEFLQALLADNGLRGAFRDDPQGTLTAHGLADLTPADVHDALVLVQDTQTDPADGWTEPDVSSDHPPLGGFGAGDDAAYGAGSDLAADDGAWTALLPEPEPGHALDDQGATDLEDIGHLDDFAEFTVFTDLPDDVPDGHDTGPTVPEGA